MNGPEDDDDVERDDESPPAEAEDASDSDVSESQSSDEEPDKVEEAEVEEAEVEEEVDAKPERRRRLTNRDRQAEIRVLDALAKSLVALPHAKLEALALGELTDVIAAARTKRKGARGRELRRIATTLRQLDPQAVAQRLHELDEPDRAEAARLKACETWRDRLLEGGDAVLGELVDAYPDADRQRLRQLVRTAKKDRTHAKSQHAFRELFREIRSLTAAPS